MRDLLSNAGFGIYHNKDLYSYTGQWESGLRHGKGVSTFPNGANYNGEYKDDKQHGQGTYINVKEYTYVGEWVDNLKQGDFRILFWKNI